MAELRTQVQVKGDKMKNTKLFITLAGLSAMLFGITVKSADPFAAKLEKSIRMSTEKYLAGSECGGGDDRPPTQKTA